MASPTSLSAIRAEALARRDRGDLNGARTLLEQAHDAATATAGEDHPEVLATGHLLATLHRQAGDLAAARRFLESALNAGGHRLGEDHPLLLAISFDLAEIADELGNRHEARRHYIRIARYGPQAPGFNQQQVLAAQAWLEARNFTVSSTTMQPAPPPAQPTPQQAPPPMTIEPLADQRLSREALRQQPFDRPTQEYQVVEQSPFAPRPSTYDSSPFAPQPPAREPVTPQPPAREPFAPQPPAREPVTPQPPAREPFAPQPPANREPFAPPSNQDQFAPPSNQDQFAPQPPTTIREPLREQPPTSIRETPRPQQQQQPMVEPLYTPPPRSYEPSQELAHMPATQARRTPPPGLPEPLLGTVPPQVVSTYPKPAPAPAKKSGKRGILLVSAAAAVVAIVGAVVTVILLKGGPGGGVEEQKPPAPAKAGNLAISSDQGSVVTLTWTDPSKGYATQVVLFNQIGGGDSTKPVSSGAQTLTLDGLNAGLNYCFRVASAYSVTQLAISDEVCTSRATPAPSASNG